MKWLAITIAAVLTLSLHAKETWIQVLSVKKDVPAAYLKDLERKKLEHRVVDEAGMKKVQVGSYKSLSDARKAMHFIRCQVASDAFIVTEPQKRVKAQEPASEAAAPASPATPRVEQVPKNLAAVDGNSKVLSASKCGKCGSKPAAKKPVPKAPDKPAETAAPAATPPVAAAKPQPTRQPCQCICDKRALKKADLADAVQYYKNSSDYHFTYQTEKIPGY
jgi:hypothetical protein